MKTNYLQRNRRNNTNTKKIIYLILILIFFGTLMSFISSAVFSGATPLWRGKNSLVLGLSGSTDWIKTKSSLIQENNRLKDLVSSQSAVIATLDIKAKREEELLSLLGRADTNKYVVAGVLVRPPETPYDTLIIDAGESQGVSVGQVVYMTEGPVLGKVIEITKNTSKIKLYSASGEKTNATLERHAVPITLLGRGGGGFVINLPRDVEVVQGDRILSAGVSPELIAVVNTVNQKSTDSFKEVLASGNSNIFNVRYVLIRK